MRNERKKAKKLTQLDIINECRDRSLRPRACVIETDRRKAERRSNAKNGKFGWRTQLMNNPY